mmetsp:Transcript_29811/g.55241  ORF Transcript_29811/g.55241 Transcript_29811/m.55241 type:complete len:397 (+) Transcript_29811:22-1212(+)
METPTKAKRPVSPRREATQGAAVVLSYDKLLNGDDLTAEIERAYGVDGLGILTVEGIPELSDARSNLLPLAHRFASLSDEKKEKYTIEDAFYAFGWSRGKEKLDGQFDYSKGSYYNNPQYDRPVDDEELIKKFPSFIHPNIWPSEDVPELEAAFKALGQLIVAVGVLVSKQCDAYVKKKCASYKENYLQQTIESSLCCKARLLHYYPKSFEDNLTPYKRRKVDENEQDRQREMEQQPDHDPFSSWCGWHNDHGSLTGLVAAIFTDDDGNIVQNTDPEAGLYIRNRKSEVVKVGIPPTHLAFQIGETAQIHSGGILQATPHAVRGSSAQGVSRQTFAVFMEPNWDEPVQCPSEISPDDAQSQNAAKNLPKGVPPLHKRWNNSMDFSEFALATLAEYH